MKALAGTLYRRALDCSGPQSAHTRVVSRAGGQSPLWVRLGSRVTQSRLPLFPQQQTFLCPAVTSEKCQQATSRPSFDHLIGAAEQHRWHFEAERFRSLEIDTQLEFGRLVKRDISRIGTSKNLIDEVGEAAIDVG
jgi:hypothetical protein